MLAGAIEGAGDVADQWTGGQPAVLCSVSGTEGSQCTVLSRKDAWIGTSSGPLVSSRAVTLMPISGMSLSIAARRLPQVGQKPCFASPSKVSYQAGSPPSPVRVTVSNPTHHITGVPSSF
jgi:hypothetical protein